MFIKEVTSVPNMSCKWAYDIVVGENNQFCLNTYQGHLEDSKKTKRSRKTYQFELLKSEELYQVEQIAALKEQGYLPLSCFKGDMMKASHLSLLVNLKLKLMASHCKILEKVYYSVLDCYSNLWVQTYAVCINLNNGSLFSVELFSEKFWSDEYVHFLENDGFIEASYSILNYQQKRKNRKLEEDE